MEKLIRRKIAALLISSKEKQKLAKKHKIRNGKPRLFKSKSKSSSQKEDIISKFSMSK